MNNYQFRTNWRGQLILRRQVRGWDIYTRSPGLYWRDATAADLKDYYEQLCKIQNPCVSPEFDSLRAVANLSKNT
jgi:hypothetical protein